MLRSTAPPMLVGTMRSPVHQGQVRVPKNGFKPRRLAKVAPGVETCWGCLGGGTAGTAEHRWGAAHTPHAPPPPPLVSPRFWICWESTIDTGLGVVKPVLAMWLPVTTISSSGAESPPELPPGGGEAGAVWALAGLWQSAPETRCRAPHIRLP